VIKKVLFLGLIVTLLSFAMHKYYVSITEADYNTKTQSFEISIKFIGHDLEKALARGGIPELYLGTPKEIEKANEYLTKYINKHFELTVNDQELVFTFVGKEVDLDDFIYCYLESDKIINPRKIDVKNSLLTELFDGQKNVVYLKAFSNQIEFNLSKEKVRETYTFRNK